MAKAVRILEQRTSEHAPYRRSGVVTRMTAAVTRFWLQLSNAFFRH
jgi:hypothetical protein